MLTNRVRELEERVDNLEKTVSKLIGELVEIDVIDREK